MVKKWTLSLLSRLVNCFGVRSADTKYLGITVRTSLTGFKQVEATLFVVRKWYTDKSTIGELEFDDFKCFTLEDTVRLNQPKVPTQTAIPAGKYETVLSYSNRFGKLMPLLLNVPGFEGVRIHSGNRPEDTEGCILVGKSYDPKVPDQITESRAAFNVLMAKLVEASSKGKVYVSIG